MKAWWIIPNRDQRDDILASDGHTIRPLKEILDPALRPEGFSHGVPTELIERRGPKAVGEILFAQKFPRWNQNKQLFFVTTPAGLDCSGRVVHLGLLFILEPQERPHFDLPYGALSTEDQAYARALIHRMASPAREDSWAQSARELAELPAGSGPATNVTLHRSSVPFNSLYDAGPGGLSRKSRFGRKRTLAVGLIILFAGAWLYERACDPNTRPMANRAATVSTYRVKFCSFVAENLGGCPYLVFANFASLREICLYWPGCQSEVLAKTQSSQSSYPIDPRSSRELGTSSPVWFRLRRLRERSGYASGGVIWRLS